MPKSFNEIPLVQLPASYSNEPGQVLVKLYNQHGPIFRTNSFGTPTVFLVGPEANRYVLTSNRSAFSHKQGWGQFFGVIDMLGDGLLTMDGEAHDQHRKMMNPAFTIAYMDRYLPIMHRIIRERVSEWVEKDQVDLYDEARKITFDIAAESLAGMSPGAEINTFRELFATLLWSDEQNITGYWVAKQSLDKLMRHKVAERRAHPTDDLLGMMVQATDDQGKGLSDEQIVAHTNILLVAGHETSTSLVAWFIYLLLSNPEYLTRVMDEQNATLVRRDDPTLEQIKAMKTLHAGLQEAERMYAPVPNGPRGVSTAFEFEGYSVPQGTFVLYGIAASHYNPQIFADPTRFDPDRFLAPREEDKRTPYSLVGFGGGPRICIGINFAQIEIKALVSHVLRNVALTVIAGQEIVQQYGVTGVPKNGIQVNVHALR